MPPQRCTELPQGNIVKRLYLETSVNLSHRKALLEVSGVSQVIWPQQRISNAYTINGEGSIGFRFG